MFPTTLQIPSATRPSHETSPIPISSVLTLAPDSGLHDREYSRPPGCSRSWRPGKIPVGGRVRDEGLGVFSMESFRSSRFQAVVPLEDEQGQIWEGGLGIMSKRPRGKNGEKKVCAASIDTRGRTTSGQLLPRAAHPTQSSTSQPSRNSNVSYGKNDQADVSKEFPTARVKRGGLDLVAAADPGADRIDVI